MTLNIIQQKSQFSSNSVQELLNDSSYHIEFNGHLTNHSKHAVIALAGLNASENKIKAFYTNHAKETPYGFGLEAPKISLIDINENNWKEFLGKRIYFASYLAFFKKEETKLGVNNLLQTYLPEVLPGWAGAFTHATIHLGWAISAKNSYMIIEGLAYMAYTYMDCNANRLDSDKIVKDSSPIESLLRISKSWRKNKKEIREWVKDSQNEEISVFAMNIHPELKRSGLQYRIACMLGKGHPLMYDIPEWLKKDADNIWEELYYMVSILYLSKPGDFVYLHLITSLYAMENIASVLPEEERKNVIKNYWVGILGIVFSNGTFPLDEKLEKLHELYNARNDQKNDTDVYTDEWKKIVTRALEEEEEHNPKLVFVLSEVWKKNNHKTVYRDAASQFTQTPDLPVTFENKILDEHELVELDKIKSIHNSTHNNNLILIPQTNYLKSLHSLVRDKNASTADFIMYSKRIINQILENCFELIPMENYCIKTPIGEEYSGKRLPSNICGVSIIRAGESMENTIREIMPSIPIGKILIQRDKITKLPHLYYSSLSCLQSKSYVILMEPMLATGGSALAAIELIINNGIKENNIIFANILSVEKGINAVHKKYPSVKIVTSSIEQKLNENAYMIPGIGDFGDRFFGTDK